MEITAKEILEKNRKFKFPEPVERIFEPEILAAMKELAERSFEAGQQRQRAEFFDVSRAFEGKPTPNKQEFIAQLFPQSES